MKLEKQVGKKAFNYHKAGFIVLKQYPRQLLKLIAKEQVKIFLKWPRPLVVELVAPTKTSVEPSLAVSLLWDAFLVAVNQVPIGQMLMSWQRS